MYIRDGIVYGETDVAQLRVDKVKPLNDMMLLLTFNNGTTRLFDCTILDGPVFAPLHDPAVFDNPRIEHGVVTWKDGEIDCAPEYMYDHSYEYEPLPVAM